MSLLNQEYSEFRFNPGTLNRRLSVLTRISEPDVTIGVDLSHLGIGKTFPSRWRAMKQKQSTDKAIIAVRPFHSYPIVRRGTILGKVQAFGDEYDIKASNRIIEFHVGSVNTP